MTKFITAIFLLFTANFSFASAYDTSMFIDDPAAHCHACNNTVKKFQACGGCKVAHYCDAQCQRLAWPSHKMWCQRNKELGVSEEVSRAHLTGDYSRDKIEALGLKYFAEIYKASYGLRMNALAKDTFYDQRASKSIMAAGLFYRALERLVRESELSLPEASGILMPGVGYLSSAEAKAISLAFNSERIFGFDIDAKAIENTKASNPNLVPFMTIGDGLDKNTWDSYRAHNIGLILLVHPLFYEFIESTKVINTIGRTMMGHIASTMPEAYVLLVAKSPKELSALNDLLMSDGFEILNFIDNEEGAFPCYSFGMNLMLNYKNDLAKPFTTDIAALTRDVAGREGPMLAKLRIAAEQRYRHLILAKAPKAK